MKNQTIVKRLRYGFVAVASLVALNGLLGIITNLFIASEADVIFEDLFPVVKECYELEQQILMGVIAVGSANHGDEHAEARVANSINTSFSQIEDIEAVLDSPSDHEILVQIRSLWSRISEESEMLVSGELGVAAWEQHEIEIEAVTLKLIAAVQRLIESVEGRMVEAMVLADRSQTIGLGAQIVVMIVAIFLAVIVGNKVSSSIVNPLDRLVSASTDLGRGNLVRTVRLEDTGDEIGKVNTAFNKMVQSQRDITEAAREISRGNLTVRVKPRSEEDTLGIALAEMITTLRTQIMTVVEGTNTLSSSVQEISASSAQLAASAAENATAISQTTSTIEEVRQTTDLASKKSKQLADEAHKNREISIRGQEATNDTVDSMTKIQHQMTTIADTIIGLSQQSQSIGQIIATVDSISEQSNVLAVNASIEAAKAGEQGKGFAVVAQEVKNLAEQSKQATKQVRDILNEIQRSTSSAIMATEQGTKVVEKGTDTARIAGGAIDSLAGNIDQSADAATQIASASQQQRVGMDQISSAMESVREASQQNASSAKQLETAVTNLNQLGTELKELTQKYRT